ncbi:MAG: ATP-binding cassette domain-containing protein [Acidimicrobiia bacterium]|nr:ATP-binding cassette domain-containing protein [Acidimicrobiia bacterium]
MTAPLTTPTGGEGPVPVPEHGAALLDVADLRVHYPVPRGKLRAVDGVSFHVGAGETLGLIGESGSGKSTVARAVLGLAPLTTGEVHLRGVRLDQLSRRELRRQRRHVQMIFQDPHEALDPRMDVWSAIAEPLRIHGVRSRTERDRRVADLLERVGLRLEHGERRPHELSGGQKQRVSIARALTLGPALLICDEAVSALDVSIQADILNLLVDLQRERSLAYLFISHDLAVVAHVADRVGVMYLGRLAEVGPADDVVARPRHPYTEALLSAEPQALPRRLRERQRIVLEGDLPSPVDPPSGCRFRTRCRYAAERCATEEPQLREVGPHRWSACHFAETLDLRGQEQGTTWLGGEHGRTATTTVTRPAATS